MLFESDLEGHSCCLKPFNLHTSETWHVLTTRLFPRESESVRGR